MGDTITADSYRVLLSGGEGEIVEKKSRFIATVRKCGTEEEAEAFIEEMKKKYWDARHNCSAFVIGSRGELTRCSDDGEPSGTAGRPMLEVLEVATDYNDVGKLQYYFGQQSIVPADSIYAENVKFILLIPVEKEENLRKNLIEITSGKVKIEKLKETYFIDKE